MVITSHSIRTVHFASVAFTGYEGLLPLLNGTTKETLYCILGDKAKEILLQIREDARVHRIEEVRQLVTAPNCCAVVLQDWQMVMRRK